MDWNVLPTFEALMERAGEHVVFRWGGNLEERFRYWMSLSPLDRQLEFRERDERMMLEMVEERYTATTREE